MAWRLNDLELGAESAVEAAQDGRASVALRLAVTASERRQVQEMCEHAGSLEETPTFEGGIIVLDTSPLGQNTLYVMTDSEDHVDPGWFAVEDAQDAWGESTTVSRVDLNLKRIAGPSNAVGQANVAVQFTEHDY